MGMTLSGLMEGRLQRRHWWLLGIAVLALIGGLLAARQTVASEGGASLGGIVYHDVNQNGVRDGGEPALPNVYITLRATGGEGWEHTFYTGNDGSYAPAGLTSGDYSLYLSVPDCYRPTTRPFHKGVWLDSGAVIRGLDFGLVKDARCGGPPTPKDPPKPYPPQPSPPPRPPSSPPVSAPPARPSTYTIQPGDQLGKIAQRFGVSLDALIQLNKISNPNLIYVGQVLRLPGGSSEAPRPVRTYVVQPGDQLGRIAERYGTTISALMAANKIINPNLIYVGQVLVIP